MRTTITSRILGAFILIVLATSCRKDTYINPNTPPSTIEGLELSYVKININTNYQKLLFLDERTGFVADYNGGIHKTDNGGLTWIKQNTGTNLPLFDMYFLNDREGFAVGGRNSCGGDGCVPAGAIILHTSDGGNIWTSVKISVSQNTELQSITFVNNLQGYASGTGVVLVTYDGGQTWKEISPSNTGTIFTAMGFKDEQNGIILGPAGKVIKTNDGGKSWGITQPLMYGGVNSLNIVEENLVYATAGCKAYKSIDFGDTWTEVGNSLFAMGNIIFKTKNVGFTVGTGDYSGGCFGQFCGAIHYSTDGGQTWKGSKSIWEIGAIRASCFVNDRLGFVLSNGVLAKIKRL